MPSALRTTAPTTSAAAGTRAMKNRTLPAQRPPYAPGVARTVTGAPRSRRRVIRSASRLNAPPTSSPSRRSRGRSESTGGAAHVRARNVRSSHAQPLALVARHELTRYGDGGRRRDRHERAR